MRAARMEKICRKASATRFSRSPSAPEAYQPVEKHGASCAQLLQGFWKQRGPEFARHCHHKSTLGDRRRYRHLLSPYGFASGLGNGRRLRSRHTSARPQDARGRNGHEPAIDERRGLKPIQTSVRCRHSGFGDPAAPRLFPASTNHENRAHSLDLSQGGLPRMRRATSRA